jgi:hypothetical protein
MDAFEKARLKQAKNAARFAAYKERVEIPEKKEEPKVKVERPKGPQPMVVTVSGPCDLVFEVDYAGSLISSQQTPKALEELFRQQLSAFGRVR